MNKEIKFLELPSVGAVITIDGMTYPMCTDGTPDFDCDIHIDDILEDEWFSTLSEVDLIIVNRIKDRL